MKKVLSMILAILIFSGCLMFSASAAETFYGPDIIEKYGLYDGVVVIPQKDKAVEYTPTPDQTKNSPATGGGGYHEKGAIKYAFAYDDTYLYVTVSVIIRENSNGVDAWWGDNKIAVHLKPAKSYSGTTLPEAHGSWYGSNEGWASMGYSGNPDRWVRFESIYVTGQGFTEGGAGYNTNASKYANCGATFETNGVHTIGEEASFTVKVARSYLTTLFGGTDDLGYALYVRSGYDSCVYGGSWINDEGQAAVGSAAGWNHWDWTPLYLLFEDIDILTSEKASVRISSDRNGLRFKTDINKEFVKQLQSVSGNVVEIGTLIAPTDSLGGAKLTHEFTGEKLDIEAYLDYPYSVGANYNTYAGSITNIKTKNLAREFTAVGYIKVTNGQNVTYYYSDVAANKAVSSVAKSALGDVSSIRKTGYDYLIESASDTNKGKYSPYTAAQRAVIATFIPA